MNSNVIPEKITNFKIYIDGTVVPGVSADVELPKLESMSETISGGGILGEFDSPTPGHFGATQVGITLRALTRQAVKIAEPSGHLLTFRASQQGFNTSASAIEHQALKIDIKYVPKSLELGTLAVAKPTDTKLSLEVLYIKIMEGSSVILELDKSNFVFVVNGVDQLAAIKRNL